MALARRPVDDALWDDLEEILLRRGLRRPDDGQDRRGAAGRRKARPLRDERPGRRPLPARRAELPDPARDGAPAHRQAGGDAGRRRQRQRQDHHHRQAGDHAAQAAQAGDGRRGRHVSRRRGRAAGHLGGARGRRVRARRGGRRPLLGGVRRHERGQGARRRRGARRYGRPPADQDQPDGRAQEDAPHDRARDRRAARRDAAGRRRHHRPERDLASQALQRSDPAHRGGGDQARLDRQGRRAGRDRRRARGADQVRRPGRDRRRAAAFDPAEFIKALFETAA